MTDPADTTDDLARAREALDRAVMPVRPLYDRVSWPIAAAMLQFPSIAPDGRSALEAGPQFWHACLSATRDLGFNSIEMSTAWLAVHELTRHQLTDLRALLKGLALRLVGIVVARQSIIDPVRGRGESRPDASRPRGPATALGAPIACLGLHGSLLQAQQEATWFWTRRGAVAPDDRETWTLAVRRLRELADHAETIGLRLSLETAEGTYLGRSDSALQLLQDIGRPNVGLNPDIANLIRQQCVVEPWEVLVVKTLPLANYWHARYIRLEAPDREIYLTAPTSLALGLIDYRKAIRFALSVGFDGAFVVEHYGGDGLAVGAMNRDYLRSVLPAGQ